MDLFREELLPGLSELIASDRKPQAKSEFVNAKAARIAADLMKSVPSDDLEFKTRLCVIVCYCHTVATLEYRQRVWNYNFMDFSRRAGELWQNMCMVPWACAQNPESFKTNETFHFCDVQQKFLSDIWDLICDHPNVEKVIDMVEGFTNPLNKINMASDKVFTKGDLLHVIDFKLSFNSNEKGNRDRLSQVGWAHRQRDPSVELLIAVCREENNAYLDSLRDEGWKIVKGRDSYERIGDLTGTRILPFLEETVAFRDDLSKEFLDYVDKSDERMRCYLEWQAGC